MFPVASIVSAVRRRTASLSPASITHVTATASATDTANYTFSGINVTGISKIIVGAGGRSATAGVTTSSVTVHVPDAATDPTGTTLTKQIEKNDGSGDVVAIYTGTIPSGATADIKVNYSNTCVRSGVSIAKLSASSITPSSTNFDSGIKAAYSAAVTVPDNGTAYGAVMAAGTTASFTWTNLTEKSDQAIEGGGIVYSTAAADFSSGGSTTITATPNATPASGGSFCIAAWSP